MGLQHGNDGRRERGGASEEGSHVPICGTLGFRAPFLGSHAEPHSPRAAIGRPIAGRRLLCPGAGHVLARTAPLLQSCDHDERERPRLPVRTKGPHVMRPGRSVAYGCDCDSSRDWTGHLGLLGGIVRMRTELAIAGLS